MKLPKNVRKYHFLPQIPCHSRNLFAPLHPQRPVVAMRVGIAQPVTLQPSPRHVVDPSAAPGRGLVPWKSCMKHRQEGIFGRCCFQQCEPRKNTIMIWWINDNTGLNMVCVIQCDSLRFIKCTEVQKQHVHSAPLSLQCIWGSLVGSARLAKSLTNKIW